MFEHWETPAPVSVHDEIPVRVDFGLEKLRHYLRSRFPSATDLEVGSVRILSGGFSKTTLMVDVTGLPGVSPSMVLRIEQPGKPLLPHCNALTDEFAALRLVHGSGIPVPEPLWLESNDQLLGYRLIALTVAPGSIMGTAVCADSGLSSAALKSVVQTLAQIHSTPLDLDHEAIRDSYLGKWLSMSDLAANTAAYVAHWEGIARRGNIPSSPLISRALKWLATNIPKDRAPATLVHCDYGLHNILIDAERVSAVLDWEVARIGDPAVDFAALLASVGNLIDEDTVIEWYLEAGGRPISPYRLRYFEVMYCTLATIICFAALARFDSSGEPDLRLLTLGLRFMRHNAGRLNGAIERAEAAGNSVRSPESARHRANGDP